MIETDPAHPDTRSPSPGGGVVAPALRRGGRPGRWRRVVALAALAAIIGVGTVGAYRYGRSYYVYRGFPPPVEPHFVQTVARKGHASRRVVVIPGTILKTNVWSATLGGRWISTYVFLPPGYYAHPLRRYPVLYFLHGLHSAGFTYLTVLGGAVEEDVLVAELRMKPTIVVIPSGPYREDTEWADTARFGRWDTFVATDLVAAIDARFRTIPSAKARALVGLSEGGYGALNIGLHHPGEFGVLESWSGYSIADATSGVFESRQELVRNSPLYTLPSVAATLMRDHVFLYFYIGSQDPFFPQNRAFAEELAKLHVPHEFFWDAGGHGWHLWRRQMVRSLIAASDHLSDATA